MFVLFLRGRHSSAQAAHGQFTLGSHLNIYARLSIHCLYFIYARKIYVRTHVKITRQWKSTLRVITIQVFAKLSA